MYYRCDDLMSHNICHRISRNGSSAFGNDPNLFGNGGASHLRHLRSSTYVTRLDDYKGPELARFMQCVDWLKNCEKLRR